MPPAATTVPVKLPRPVLSAACTSAKVTPPPENRLGSVQRSWFDADGRPWDGRALKVGDLMLVRVEVKPTRRADDALYRAKRLGRNRIIYV
mgnify:CR=1 FL=1